MAVISRIYLVQEFADSTFQIAVMGIERCPCTGLAVRRRLPSDAIPDPSRLLALPNLLVGTERWAAAIAVSP